MYYIRYYRYQTNGYLISHHGQTVRVIGASYFAFFKNRYERAKVPDMQTHELELWNCFSYYPICNIILVISLAQRGKYIGKDKKFYKGEYLFTIDWAHPDFNILDTDHSEIPQEHKCGHVY